MESLLGEKPYMVPLSTISSTGAETSKSKPSLSSTSSSSSSSGICDNKTSDVDNCVPRKSACNILII